MTTTVTLLPIIAAIKIGLSIFGSPLVPETMQHQEFCSRYHAYESTTDLFSGTELKAKISPDVTVVNQFLMENGFSISLQPGSDMYVATILHLAMEWATEGEQTTINVPDGFCFMPVPAVEKKDGFTVLKLTDGRIVVKLETKSKDTVYMSLADEQCEGFVLFDKIERISKQCKTENLMPLAYDDVVFPMVDIDQQPDISWLVGMGVGSHVIDQALQQTKFRMNEKGATVESAVAISFARCCMQREIYKIDQPFYVWVEREGVQMPIFAAYADKDCWKRPQSL